MGDNNKSYKDLNKNNICIVIPIYKKVLNSLEEQSVRQCVKVLSEYTIFFAHPENINLQYYIKNFSTIQFISFNDDYFNGLDGYNQLLLNFDFYNKFIDYEYMLIYQTDCYVFEDLLLEWSNKGYDYIGGVWFERFTGNPEFGAKEWLPGNGGFSLRNVSTFINIIKSKKPIKNYKQLISEKYHLRNNDKLNFIKELFKLPFNLFGYENNYSYLALNSKLNEDVFVVNLSIKYNKITIPKIQDAIFFSWDRCPKYLFEKYKVIPFGVHAWNRDDFPYEGNLDFWKMKILKQL